MRGRDAGRPGFTLIEMIIVFTLIGILVGLGLPQYQTAAKRAREAVLKEDLFQFRKLIDQYYLDKRMYPASLQTLVEEKYLRAIPVDPITNSATTWIEVRETPSPDELTPPETLGVVDVKSGSEMKALDKTPYNTW
ncbi:MAG: type II secretion system GspH family protein [Candidatus Aminicenantes bacterium]|jgi:general secretion pathway protein G|nr:type II secretion system GspH family protein [Candidatus Aminicenantes bacterium]